MSWTPMPPMPANERFQELLVDRATEGLSGQQEEQMCRLLLDNPEISAGMLELPAAAAQLAFAQMHAASRDSISAAQLPEGVETGLASAAEAFKATLAASSGQATGASEPTTAASSVLAFDRGQRQQRDLESPAPSLARKAAAVPAPTPRAVSWSGWAAAAAAALVAAIGWWRPLPEPEVRIVEMHVEVPARGPELADVRAAADLIEVPWTALEDPAVGEATGGEVLWSNQLQAGFMIFDGLAANDPQQFQYQLWIFDSNQDEAHPIDGGVFDVNADGTATVPIDAKLDVTQPTLFAITVEKPGGVVVSSRERLALIAPVAS